MTVMSRPINAIVAELRERAKLSPDELASAVKISEPALREFEQRGSGLSIANIEDIAEYFQVSAAALLRGELDPAASLRLFFNKRGAYDFFADDERLVIQALRQGEVLMDLRRLAGGEEDLRTHFQPEPPGETPYKDGYLLAQRVRELLGNPDRCLEDLDVVLEERFGILVCDTELRPDSIQAISAKARSGAAVILLNRNNAGHDNPLWRRGNLAHELGHVLADPPEDGFNNLVVDQDSQLSWWNNSPVEQRAKAFAAELLIPSAGLRRILNTQFPATQEATALGRIADVRAEFQTTFETTLYHLVNQEYITKALKDRLQQQWRRVADPAVKPAAQPSPLWRRVQQVLERGVITELRAREILGLSVWDPLPWAATA